MPRPSTSAIPKRLLVGRWVRAPAGKTVPGHALGEVHRAHHIAVLDAHTKHVWVTISIRLPIACVCASYSDPSLPFMEARREARVAVLLIGILVGECVQARAIGVYPVEVGGALLALGQAAEEQ